MKLWLRLMGLPMVLALAAAARPIASPAPYTALTHQFVEAYDATQGLDPPARVAAFKARLGCG